MSDILAVIRWWLILQILGMAVWPLAFRLLRWLPDRGYMLAKPLGLLLLSYTLWGMISLGLIQNTLLGIVGALSVVVVFSQWVYRHHQKQSSQDSTPPFRLRDWLHEHYPLVMVYELVLALAFIGWAIFRAYNPDVISGEKSMELAFLNAIGRSGSFPPYDPWLAGYTIPYYYFGFFMMSILSRLSGATAGLTFSLSNALWFALSAAGAFGVVANLVWLSARRAKLSASLFGLLGAIMLVLMGNFETSLEVAHVAGWGTPQFWTQLDILDLNQPYTPPAAGQPAWPPRHADPRWWWRASRVIHDYPPTSLSPPLARVLGKPPGDNTEFQELVDEFPQFSFLFGDMHPHVLNIPFALLAIGLALNLYRASVTGEATSLWRHRRPPLWFIYPVTIGALSFLNSWDFPLYWLLLIGALSLGRWQARSFSIRNGLGDALMLGLTSLVLYLPYYLNFQAPIGGLWPNIFNGTRASQFFVAFGPLIVIGVLFGLKVTLECVQSGQLRPGGLALRSILGGLALISVAAVAAAALGVIVYNTSPRIAQWFANLMAQLNGHDITITDHLLARLLDPWTPLFLASGAAAIMVLWRARRDMAASAAASVAPTDFVLWLFCLGLLTCFATEFVFVLDLEKTRTNFVFKLYYQVWVLWSVGSAYGVYYLLCSASRVTRRASRIGVSVVLTSAVGLGLIYPALAIPSRVNESQITAPGLDAMQATSHNPRYPSIPDTYAAVSWLNEHVSGSPIVLEATSTQLGTSPGRPRLSSWTGLPTLLGQPQHELQWRSNDAIQNQRLSDITIIYSTIDLSAALSLLKQYHVSYVVVGDRERALYPTDGLAKFARSLPIVFQQGTLTIYRVP